MVQELLAAAQELTIPRESDPTRRAILARLRQGEAPVTALAEPFEISLPDREVVAPERLVSTEVFEGFSEVGYRPEDDTVSTAILTERDGKTIWTATIIYPSKEIRDGALATPMEEGMNGSFDRLDAVLATMA